MTNQLNISLLTSVNVPDLDATVVQARRQQQLVLAEREAVPLDVDAAALLLRHGRAEGQGPHGVSAVNGVVRGLAARGDHLASVAVLAGEMPGARGIGDLDGMAHWTEAAEKQEKVNTEQLQTDRFSCPEKGLQTMEAHLLV